MNFFVINVNLGQLLQLLKVDMSNCGDLKEANK